MALLWQACPSGPWNTIPPAGIPAAADLTPARRRRVQPTRDLREQRSAGRSAVGVDGDDVQSAARAGGEHEEHPRLSVEDDPAAAQQPLARGRGQHRAQAGLPAGGVGEVADVRGADGRGRDRDEVDAGDGERGRRGPGGEDTDGSSDDTEPRQRRPPRRAGGAGATIRGRFAPGLRGAL